MAASGLRGTHVNLLVQDELDYELAVRGASIEGSVEDRRKALRTCLQLEKNNLNRTYPSYPFTFTEDCGALEGKLKEVEALVASFKGVEGSAEHKKLVAKTTHALARIERCDPDGYRGYGCQVETSGAH